MDDGHRAACAAASRQMGELDPMEHAVKAPGNPQPQHSSAAMTPRRADASAQQNGLAESISQSPRITAQREQVRAIERSPRAVAQREVADTMRPRTGLPDGLRAGIETLSGLPMDDVKVHYNSSQPAQLNALAYAQGRDIHLAPGQEQHLPHEAWHVVQQAQGRVQPTTQMEGDAPTGSAPPIQGKFSDAEIRRIAMLSMRRRIEVLARVSADDLDSWYESAEFGSMYLGAEESDEIRELRQQHLDEAEMDSLADAMQGLSLQDPADDLAASTGRPADENAVASLPGVEVDRIRFDADGDVRMHDIDGEVDVDMTDVSGTMDVDISDVQGTIDMDIDDVDADVHIKVSDIDGYVHVSLMDIDLTPSPDEPLVEPAPRGVLRLDIRGVHGVLDLQVWHSAEPMDISIDTVARDEHVTRRVDKRKRASDEPPLPQEEERRKRARMSPESDPLVDALTESMSALDIREPFFAQMDQKVHELYPDASLSDLIVHSDPVPLMTVIAKKKWQGFQIGGNAIKALKALAAKATTALKAMSSPTLTKGRALREVMKLIGKELAKLKPVPLPKTVLGGTNFPSNSGLTEGKKAKADPLSLDSSKGAVGSGPTTNSRLMDGVRAVARPLGENKSYKMMHLLNHKVYGPGQLWNMTPGPSASNIHMESDIEEPLKRAIHDKCLVMGFEATVDYKADPMAQPQGELNRNPDGYRFKKIDFKAWEYELNAAGTAFDEVSTNPDVDVATIDGGKVVWDYGGLTVLREKPRLLDPNTSVQDLLDAELPSGVANKIWQFNQDAAAKPAKAFVVPSSDKKGALIRHIKRINGDSRAMTDKWNANGVNWS